MKECILKKLNNVEYTNTTVSDKIIEEDGKLYQVQEHNFKPIITRAKILQDMHGQKDSGFINDSKLVGIIPAALIYEWAKQAGVSYTDSRAIQEIIKRKLNSSEFKDFRIWKGFF